MQKLIRKAGIAVAILVGAVPQVVSAQTFFERLTEQLGRAVPPAIPPSAPSPQPSPAESPRGDLETLPPPRGFAGESLAGRPALGIRVGPVTDEVVRAQKLLVRRGAVINSIDQGSAADKAGLPLGAVIVAVDGRRVDSPDDLVAAIQASQPGRDLEITYYDQDKLARKRVHLAAASAPGLLVPSPANSVVAPVSPVPAVSSPLSPSPSTSSGMSLERELNAGGSRPILGRIGRALDNFATQAQALQPQPQALQPQPQTLQPQPQALPPQPQATPPAPQPQSVLLEHQGVSTATLAELQRQLGDLTREVQALRKKVSELERKLPRE